jgi:serine/threonine-protein kinase PpkA
MSIEIPGYKILGELGEGGMARVYVALQESLEREVAIKILSASLVSDAEFCERFLREGKTLAKLNHPNIVAIYDSGVQGGNYYLAMEYIRGGTLEDYLQDKRLEPRQCINVVKQVALALDVAHARDLIHRDVKPGNVLFRDSDTAVLSDFGIAKSLGTNTRLTAVGMAIGTPTYMSPEQASAKPVTSKSDQYSLGVMLFEMLTGSVPYTGDDQVAVAIQHIQAPVPTLPDEFKAFQPIIDRMMAKDPADRFADGKECVAALDQFISPATVLRTEVMAAPSTQRNRTVMTIAGSALAAALAVGIGTFLWMKGDSTSTLESLSALEAISPPAATKVELDAETQAVVSDLIATAESHFEIGRLTEPPGGNAFEAFRQALDMDPGNKRAQTGLTRIADTYEGLARESLQSGELDEGTTIIEQGLKVMPNHKGLTQLQQQIAQR